MYKKMQESYGLLERRRQGILKKMGQVGAFIMATPTPLMVRCGRPGCPCEKDKAKRHEKLHLSWKDAQGSGTAYVPKDLQEEVIKWVENYWKVKEYMKEMTAISRQMIKMYAKTVGAHKRRMQKKAKEKKV